MSEKSGPLQVLQVAKEHAVINTYYDVTNTITMGTRANSIRLFVVSSVSSPGDVSFRLSVANPTNALTGATTYYDYCTQGEAPETFGPLTFSAAAQTKMLILEGIDLLPNDVVQVSYAASANAAGAKVAIVGETYHSDSSSTNISVGDIEISVEALEVLLADIPNVIGTDGSTGPSKVLSIGGTDAATGKIEEISVDALGRVDVAPIDGQSGIAANAGAMDALTTRVTVATDDTHFGAVGAAADVDGVVHGQLHSIGLAVEIMDDWDESDRAKVNPIAGQAGIAANTGAMDALTTRVTIATDDTLTAAANTLLGTIDTDTGVIAGDTTSIDAKVPALGSAAMAASSPVTVATDDTVMAAINALITAGNVDLAALEVLLTASNVDLAAMEVLLGTIDADTSNLASAYTGATTSLRVEEIDPLSAQYLDSNGGTSLGSTTTVAAAGTTYYPSSAGQALDGYTTSLVGLYCTGGIETGPTNCTNTLTLEATIGLEVAAADRWLDIGASVLDCTTGASWAGSIVSTGTTAAECLLDLGHNAPMKIRIKSVVAGGSPDATNASVEAALTASAL